MIIPVIMAGGSGTRLWPASRETMPKQFIPLFGDQSAFQETLMRVANPALFKTPIVITNSDFRFLAAEQSRSIETAPHIVLEPERKDSAPAVSTAALLALKDDPEALVLILAADHYVPDTQAFQHDCESAMAAAKAGYIVTFGVKPSNPATGYGYIKPEADLDMGGSIKIDRFVEKPDFETAKRYCADGYLWNSGNFLFRADVMRDELLEYAPSIVDATSKSITDAVTDLDFLRLDAEAFAASPKISIDYAVMEKTNKAAVFPATFEWSDIGSWDACWSLASKDESGNALVGNAFALDTTNTYISGDEGILTAAVGVDNAVIVSTPDAVLVTTQENAASVKKLVEALKAKQRKEAVEHSRVYRPWGHYQSIDVGPRYQVKQIVVKSGASLSLQKHFHRSEHWVVVRGTAEVTIDDEVKTIQENESVYLPIGCVHRLYNPGKIPLSIIEVQVGSYLGEDDIVRFEDLYNRVDETKIRGCP